VSDQFPNAAILAPQDFTACGKTRSGGRPGIYPRHKSFRINGALQAAEKPFPTGKKCQGTTSVVPQVQQNKRWASAPEGCSAGFRTANRPFSAASSAPGNNANWGRLQARAFLRPFYGGNRSKYSPHSAPKIFRKNCPILPKNPGFFFAEGGFAGATAGVSAAAAGGAISTASGAWSGLE
jgi:hypothetical protein